ncbi:MAG: nucleotide sugar dehydrogenase [Acidimicrobiales bacterium]
MTWERDVVIVGGCGHVGLPLGLAFADQGLTVDLYDIDDEAVAAVNAGILPAVEDGAQEVLDRVIGGRMIATADPAAVSRAEHVVIVIGTPVGRLLNPLPDMVPRAIAQLAPLLRPGQHMVLRSTVYPGVTRAVERLLADTDVDISFCPERIAEGKAMTELYELPQIVAARDPETMARATRLFSTVAASTIELEPEEAELAKLFTNVWRYVKFAAANQLYMIANDMDLDFDRIRGAITQDYPRAADMVGPGFAAGPCLLKDTIQLADSDRRNFALGQASVVINEQLPNYVVSRLADRFDLSTSTVGILGMAFKGESDDIRSSLAYKLKRALLFSGAEVLCHDPYVVDDPELEDLEKVLNQADVLVIGAPHRMYADLPLDLPVADLFNVTGSGVQV